MKKIIRAIRNLRRRYPISFRLAKDRTEHIAKNPKKKPVVVPSLEEIRILLSTKEEAGA